MKFKIYPKVAAQFYYDDVPHIIISIAGTNEEPAKWIDNENCLDILYLHFEDMDMPMTGVLNLILFNEKHARQILDFVNKYINDAELVICQCNAGVSRSAGVAAALSKIYLKDDMDIFGSTQYMPNRRVYSTILNTEYGLNMIREEIEKWKSVIDDMSQIEMAKLHRFAPAGHPVFKIGAELPDYFNARFRMLGGMTPEISKLIG